MRGTLEVDVAPCVQPPVAQRKKGFSARWSLRRFIYSSPILGRRRTPPNPSAPPPTKSNWGRDVADGSRSSAGGSSTVAKGDIEKGNASGLNHHHAEIHKATSRSSVFTASTKVSSKIYYSEFSFYFVLTKNPKELLNIKVSVQITTK